MLAICALATAAEHDVAGLRAEINLMRAETRQHNAAMLEQAQQQTELLRGMLGGNGKAFSSLERKLMDQNDVSDEDEADDGPGEAQAAEQKVKMPPPKGEMDLGAYRTELAAQRTLLAFIRTTFSTLGKMKDAPGPYYKVPVPRPPRKYKCASQPSNPRTAAQAQVWQLAQTVLYAGVHQYHSVSKVLHKRSYATSDEERKAFRTELNDVAVPMQTWCAASSSDPSHHTRLQIHTYTDTRHANTPNTRPSSAGSSP